MQIFIQFCTIKTIIWRLRCGGAHGALLEPGEAARQLPGRRDRLPGSHPERLCGGERARRPGDWTVLGPSVEDDSGSLIRVYRGPRDGLDDVVGHLVRGHLGATGPRDPRDDRDEHGCERRVIIPREHYPPYPDRP